MAMIGDVMRWCNNYFDTATVEGTFEVAEDGTLANAEQLGTARYIAIHGSAGLDGVWQLIGGKLAAEEGMITPETFDGTIWLLSPPREFVALCRRIADFEAKTPVSAVQSESFGAYSHTMMTGKGGGAVTWQEAFATSLVRYRKMFTGVQC